ncbi:MAG TPA: lyase family protein [Solirubrobacteraceae bacterium]
MPFEPGLFGGIYARGETAAQLDDAAWLRAMLDVEAALARACADQGLIPAASAQAIAAACVPERFDVVELGLEAARNASPVVGLVRALRNLVGEPAREHVHAGATSQDVLDSALMLIAQRALEPLLVDAAAAADAAALLADAHRRTPMAGRTLLQQALPVSFGLRAAGWLQGIDSARARLSEIRGTQLAVQMGGPVGARAPAIAAAVASELGLAAPVMPWQAIRVRPAVLADALGVLAGVLSKIARDATLLAQQEVGEAAEGGDETRGGSSAMAHKHNPVAAVSLLACTKRVPGLVATVLACMEQEHERAAGAWQAEWGVHTELLGLVGSATSWARELLEHLAIDPQRMAENLERLARAGVDQARAPLEHLDGAEELIDRALAMHRSQRGSG